MPVVFEEHHSPAREQISMPADVRAILSVLELTPSSTLLLLGCSKGSDLVRALRRSGHVLPAPSSAILPEGVAGCCSSSTTERPCGR